jgi:hypothetical protein
VRNALKIWGRMLKVSDISRFLLHAVMRLSLVAGFRKVNIAIDTEKTRKH